MQYYAEYMKILLRLVAAEDLVMRIFSHSFLYTKNNTLVAEIHI